MNIKKVSQFFSFLPLAICYSPHTAETRPVPITAGLQEMLLASCNGVIEIMPAVPAGWQDVSFSGLRAEGAFIISAEKKKGQMIRVEILSEQGGTLRLKNPFQQNYAIEMKNATKVAQDSIIIFSCQKEERIIITLFL